MRAERKKWVKTLQRLECVDAASYAAMLDGLKDVSAFYSRALFLFFLSFSNILPPILIVQRHEKRVGWAAREKDGIFASLAKDCVPLPCPLVERLLQQNNKPEAALASLPRVTSLMNMVQCVEQWQKAFDANKTRLAAAPKDKLVKK